MGAVEYMHMHVRMCTSVRYMQRSEESVGNHPSRLLITETGLWLWSSRESPVSTH